MYEIHTQRWRKLKEDRQTAGDRRASPAWSHPKGLQVQGRAQAIGKPEILVWVGTPETEHTQPRLCRRSLRQQYAGDAPKRPSLAKTAKVNVMSGSVRLKPCRRRVVETQGRRKPEEGIEHRNG
jgi:hypothetical protein